jgi:drug/metabolite transporter, DME family
MSFARWGTARRGVSLLVAAGVLWGTGGLLGRLLAELSGWSPLAVAAVRLGLGGVLLVVYVAATGGRVPRGRTAWRRIWATGLLAALFQVSYFTAVTLTGVSFATLVTIGCAPVLVLLVRWRSASIDQLFGVLLALLGLGLLVGAPAVDAAAGRMLLGALLGVLAAAGFAVMTLVNARPVEGLDEVTATGASFVVGGAVLIPFAVVLDAGAAHAFDARAAGWSALVMLALALGPTALAYTCYFRGLHSTSPGTGSVMALLEPLTAAVLAALLLGERLGISGLVAGGVLGCAMVLTARAAPGRPAEPGRSACVRLPGRPRWRGGSRPRRARRRSTRRAGHGRCRRHRRARRLRPHPPGAPRGRRPGRRPARPARSRRRSPPARRPRGSRAPGSSRRRCA